MKPRPKRARAPRRAWKRCHAATRKRASGSICRKKRWNDLREDMEGVGALPPERGDVHSTNERGLPGEGREVVFAGGVRSYRRC